MRIASPSTRSKPNFSGGMSRIPCRVVSLLRRSRRSEYLSHNLDRRVPVDELAGAVHLSPSRLAHLFKQETGVSPRRSAELQRLERAKQLLGLTSMPVYQVAQQAGFESQFYFATRFRKVTGRTPSEFRASRRLA
jgi:AraC family transcriptional regulator, arabinose operon regulatory protein